MLEEAGLPGAPLTHHQRAGRRAGTRGRVDCAPGRQADYFDRVDTGRADDRPSIGGRHLKPCSARTRGKAPLVILDDADLGRGCAGGRLRRLHESGPDLHVD